MLLSGHQLTWLQTQWMDVQNVLYCMCIVIVEDESVNKGVKSALRYSWLAYFLSTCSCTSDILNKFYGHN